MEGQGIGNDLDKLIAAYEKISPPGLQTFKALVTKYFRQENLGQLLNEALDQQKQLGCPTSI